MNSRILVPVLSVIGFSIAMALTGVVVAPVDAWPNVLLCGYFLTGLGLSGGFVVAVHDVSGGRWLGPVRQIAFSLMRLVLPGSIIVLVAITLSGTYLYGHDLHHGFKAWWLGRTFFAARAVVYVALWLLSIRSLRRGKGAAAFLVIFSLTVWLSSFDWIMALEPHWASTIFGVYHFAGLVTAGLAVMAIVAVARAKRDSSITSDHIHDVGKLLFAFSTFWMYIWFSQAMLTWYTNIPEEAVFYTRRAFGNWGVLFWAVVLLEWVIPFLVLLSEGAKRNGTTLTRVAVAVLIGHWLDLYVAVVPTHAVEPRLVGWELALAIGAFGAVGWAVTRVERPRAVALDESPVHVINRIPVR